jgi:gamma-glutamyl hercynylcysteine S-oxide hydrolase
VQPVLVCRVVGYVGGAIRARDVVSAPPHSLYVQSYKPREMQSGTVNADGYGCALWLDDGVPEPALYRTPAPIWADPNQKWLNDRLSARSLIAAVRSATPGIGFELANVQPFAHGRMAFVHNGFIEGFHRGPERALRDSLGREAYEGIEGSSDSEHIFALVRDSPGPMHEAVRRGIERLEGLCEESGRKAVATVLVGDGEQLVAVRWARGYEPASLYGAPFAGGFCFASEPLDEVAHWRAIPPRQLAVARGRELHLEAL